MEKFMAGLACGSIMAGRSVIAQRWPLAVALIFVAAPAVAQDISFRSPTGNIHCMIFSGAYAGARCDLARFTPSYPRPVDCDLDWGFGFEVGVTGPGSPICAGDTVRQRNAKVLKYGQSVTRSGITCTSAKTGMTCVNAQGHGFTVARAWQRAF